LIVVQARRRRPSNCSHRREWTTRRREGGGSAITGRCLLRGGGLGFLNAPLPHIFGLTVSTVKLQVFFRPSFKPSPLPRTSSTHAHPHRKKVVSSLVDCYAAFADRRKGDGYTALGAHSSLVSCRPKRCDQETAEFASLTTSQATRNLWQMRSSGGRK